MSFRTLIRKATHLAHHIHYAYWKGAKENCFPIGKYGLFGNSAISPDVAKKLQTAQKV